LIALVRILEGIWLIIPVRALVYIQLEHVHGYSDHTPAKNQQISQFNCSHLHDNCASERVTSHKS